MMTNDEVLKQNLEFLREPGYLYSLGIQHIEFNDHVSKQLPAACVGERTRIRELIDFADIVEEGPRKQQVSVYLRIVLAYQIARPEKCDHVIEQAADISVVQGLGAGTAAEGWSNLWILHKGLQQGLWIWFWNVETKSASVCQS